MTSRRQMVGGMMALAAGSVLAACQAPMAGPQPVVFIPENGVGSIFFNAPIVAGSRDLLIADIEGLIKAGARTIRLAINSPGGDVSAAQGIVDYMTAAHATRGIEFEAYSIGMVASAATYVFMNAQRRYARAGSAFLFHAAGMVSTGAVSAERLREEANKIEAYERAVRTVLKARTRLTDDAIGVYLHRTVVLSADDAKRDGVVDAIAPFPNSRVITIAVKPATTQTVRTVAPIPDGR